MGIGSSADRSMFPRADEDGGPTAPWRFSHYVLWRSLGAVLVVFTVLTATFIAVEVVPGIPYAFFFPGGCRTPAACDAIRQQLTDQWALDQPVFDRYARFVGNVLTGNLGVSVVRGVPIPVSTLIADALPTTLALLGLTLVFVALVALAMGLILSRRRGSVADAVVSLFLAFPFAATPPVLGFVAIYVFVVHLQLVQMPGPGSGVALGYDAVMMLFLVGTTAGLFTWTVRDHPLRPPAVERSPAGDSRAPVGGQTAWFRRTVAVFLAGLPALTAWTVAAVMLTEVFWDINGVGLLLWRSLLLHDVVTVMGILLAVGLLVILPFIVTADILHEWLTSDWRREDGRSIEGLDIEPTDAPRGLRRLLESASGFAGIVLLLILVGMPLAAPLIVGPYPTGLDFTQANQPPSAAHLLGTDSVGRDILTLLLYGGGSAIPVALVAFAVALWVGVGLVFAQGALGARADVFLTIPLDAGLILGSLAGGLLAFQVFGRTLEAISALLAWPITTRILLLETRGLVRSPRIPPPVRPSRGDRGLRLVWGTSPLILGNAFLSVAIALSLWATFGLLGVSPLTGPQVMNWGEMLNLAWNNLAWYRDAWWMFLPPALGILTAVLAPTLLALSTKRIPLPRGPRPQPPAVPEVPREASLPPHA